MISTSRLRVAHRRSVQHLPFDFPHVLPHHPQLHLPYPSPIVFPVPVAQASAAELLLSPPNSVAPIPFAPDQTRVFVQANVDPIVLQKAESVPNAHTASYSNPLQARLLSLDCTPVVSLQSFPSSHMPAYASSVRPRLLVLQTHARVKRQHMLLARGRVFAVAPAIDLDLVIAFVMNYQARLKVVEEFE